MNKLLISAIGVLVLVGGGCEKQVVQQKNTVEQAATMAVYSNTVGKYSFSYPETVYLIGIPGGDPVQPSSLAVDLLRKGTIEPIGLNFLLIKSTVYPESKLAELTKKYFDDKAVKTKQITINEFSGWEVSLVDKPTGRLNGFIYIPHGSYELIIFEYLEADQEASAILQSLHPIK